MLCLVMGLRKIVVPFTNIFSSVYGPVLISCASIWLNALNERKKFIHSGNKLRTYSTFKQTFEFEPYLNFTSDYRRRKVVTKLRISQHKLEIVQGRYLNRKKVKHLSLV